MAFIIRVDIDINDFVNTKDFTIYVPVKKPRLVSYLTFSEVEFFHL